MPFPGGSSNFIWGYFGYYSWWFICTLCPWWLCWHLWEPVPCSRWGWQPALERSGRALEIWEEGKTLIYRELLLNAQRQGLGSAFAQLTPAGISQPSLWATSHLFCLKFLVLPSSGSRKIWEFGSMKSGGRKLSDVEGAFWWMQAKPTQIMGIMSCWKLPLPICFPACSALRSLHWALLLMDLER